MDEAQCLSLGLARARGMRFAEEIVAASFVPTWRSLLTRALDARGLNQTDIASLMGISQSAVSKHLTGRLGPDPRLESEPRIVETVARVADGLAARTLSAFDVLAAAQALVRELEDRGPICRVHEEEMPALQGLGCDLCVRIGASELVPEQAALSDLRAGLRVLENTPALAALLPHVGSNLVRALPGGTRPEDVAAVPGALFEMRGVVKVPAPPEFGVSRHMARVLLAVVRHDSRKLACLNLKPAPALLAAARDAGLDVREVAPAFEEAPDRLDLGASVPDVFHHKGAFGLEPQAYLVGEDAQRLALRVRGLVEPSGPSP